jgi:hypothetical protein
LLTRSAIVPKVTRELPVRSDEVFPPLTDAFVHYENLLFRKQLANPWFDDMQRQQLLKLLAEEEAKEFQNRRSHRSIGDRLGRDQYNASIFDPARPRRLKGPSEINGIASLTRKFLTA